jgi:phosphoribosylanthranilate isomerase
MGNEVSDVFRIKICGITTVDDARACVRAGGEAVGLNFYRASPRCLEFDAAQRIVEVLGPEMVKVGLFVNASVEQVCRTFDQLGLDLIQLHGDEPPELLSQFGGRPVMRAFRVGAEGLGPVEHYLDQCRRLVHEPRRVLIDSRTKGSYGGTGQVADWSTVARYPTRDWHPPLVLAGGLTPENVAEAIRVVRPAAVDTASGVESSPGRKDPAAVLRFVREAEESFRKLP